VRYQPIYDIAEVCAAKGLHEVIACPGSRCAPLTLAFAQHDKINLKTFSDERSAAFVAMGMAQQLQNPVALLCTSGSAAYNFAPAVAEAFFQEIPLIVFTADRPKEWIDQWDGQTIRQQNIFGQHVKKSYTLPEDYSHEDAVWFIHRTINEAINLANEFPKGPVHINAPFREPLYPAVGEKISFSSSIKVIETPPSSRSLSETELQEIKKKLSSTSKILILAGQQDFDEEACRAVEKFTKHFQVPLIGDILSNFHGLQNTIRHADSFLAACGEDVKKSLQPELLITFGKSIISKNTKLLLRKYKPQEHWHIQSHATAPDTFKALTKIIRSNAASFFKTISSIETNDDFADQKRENFLRVWNAEENRCIRAMKSFKEETEFNELSILKEFISALPIRCNLHLANSMSVRYANFVGIEAGKKGIHVYSNRGASGIDGCSSTAVGHAISSDVPNFLITGDMAFFYDRNAFWHNYPLPNLHILMLNNHGGIIFNIIDGPGNTQELKEFFVTHQKLNAANLCKDFGFDHFVLDSVKKIKNGLKDFLIFDGQTKIVEVESGQESNKKAFENFKHLIKNGYGT
jgi:2-succinyl-5-enolpyruvyl-6-hydroxy-3-cyclohexene-1-carboxylate synthase